MTSLSGNAAIGSHCAYNWAQKDTNFMPRLLALEPVTPHLVKTVFLE